MKTPPTGQVALVMLRGAGIWNAGEVACFPERQANAMVNAGQARFADAGQAPQPEDLRSMDIDQLRARAAELGVAVEDLGAATHPRKFKSALIEAIERALPIE